MPAQSEVYAELYLHAHSPANAVSLYRSGTRVLENLTELEAFARMPWTSGYVQGIIDAPYLNLTPGTRLGVIHDAALARLAEELAPLEARLAKIIEDQQRAEEERASRDVLRSVQGALKEALLALPAEEYDWFDLHRGEGKRRPRTSARSGRQQKRRRAEEQAVAMEAAADRRRLRTAAAVLRIRGSAVFGGHFADVERHRSRRLARVTRDRARSRAAPGGTGSDICLERFSKARERSTRSTERWRRSARPAEPGLARVEVVVTQGDVVCRAEAQITVTASLVTKTGSGDSTYQGLPGYTYHKAAGELWRSRFDAERNLVVINNGHRDFVYAARNKMLKLRYICRLFAKELVLKNFVGIPQDQLLERLLELTLYTEENLR